MAEANWGVGVLCAAPVDVRDAHGDVEQHLAAPLPRAAAELAGPDQDPEAALLHELHHLGYIPQPGPRTVHVSDVDRARPDQVAGASRPIWMDFITSISRGGWPGGESGPEPTA